MSGKKHVTTYGLRDVPAHKVRNMQDFARKELRIPFSFKRQEEDYRIIDLIFDASKQEVKEVLDYIPKQMREEVFEIQGELPDWAKDILVDKHDSRN